MEGGGSCLPWSALPLELRHIIDHARADLLAGPILGCVHLHGTEMPFVCASHPRGGLRCHRCACDHATRHDLAEEMTCDRCRRVVGVIHPTAMPLVAAGLTVRTVKGHRSLLYGVVTVVGVGLCEWCLPTGVAA